MHGSTIDRYGLVINDEVTETLIVYVIAAPIPVDIGSIGRSMGA
jgi:hypothetical protein